MRMMWTGAAVLVCGVLAGPVAVAAEEWVDWEAVAAIREEGFERSQVMSIVEHLTERIGPRLTNSPQQMAAARWTRDTMESWGLKNAALEPWGEFGRGWSFDHVSVRMVSPAPVVLFALPKAWTPGTDGAVRGAAMRVSLSEEEDFEEHRGTLQGKVLFMDRANDIEVDDENVYRRYSESDLEDIEPFRIPGEPSPNRIREGRKRYEFRQKLLEFLIAEQPLALVEVSSRENGIVRVSGNRSYEIGADPGPPQLYMIAEHYNRVVRLLDEDVDVEIELAVQAQFHEEDAAAYNVVAEIPGRNRDEVVMLGGHLDSWHAGTGATDNASGVAVAMEAMRILNTLDTRHRRTIRIALWTGEEQGLLGSRAYVEKHFASRPEPADEEELKWPAYLRKQTWPLTPKPEHRGLSAYFNFDNGGGKIRGIYGQGNAAAAPIFAAWLEPLHDLGATTVSLRDTGSTDHVPFDAVGLPGFQFIQDPLEYFSRTHHTHLDVFDHLVREDLLQSAVVMATFVYHAANRDELLPRKPFPKKPPEDEEEAVEEDS